MLLQIPNVLTRGEVAKVTALIDDGEWVDGNETSGTQSALAKRNRPLRSGSPEAERAGHLVMSALERNPLFLSAALPFKVHPPMFSRYSGGQSFADHVDNAIRPLAGSHDRIRTDVSATLFLNDPASYQGGELTINDTYGQHRVKLPAGSMVIYPSSSLHHVTPVTEGERSCAVFWTQSMVREDSARTLLFELDTAIQKVHAGKGADSAVKELTGVYHNLVRRWADV